MSPGTAKAREDIEATINRIARFWGIDPIELRTMTAYEFDRRVKEAKRKGMR